MRLYFFIILRIIFFQSCKNNSSNPQELVEEIKSRENYENFRTISISDTTQSSFNQVVIKDTVFRKTIISETKSFYKQNKFQTRWLYESKPTPLFYEYLKVLEYCEDYGLNPNTYRYEELKQAIENLYASSPAISEIENCFKIFVVFP